MARRNKSPSAFSIPLTSLVNETKKGYNYKSAKYTGGEKKKKD